MLKIYVDGADDTGHGEPPPKDPPKRPAPTAPTKIDGIGFA